MERRLRAVEWLAPFALMSRYINQTSEKNYHFSCIIRQSQNLHMTRNSTLTLKSYRWSLASIYNFKNYNLNGNVLSETEEERDLGVLIINTYKSISSRSVSFLKNIFIQREDIMVVNVKMSYDFIFDIRVSSLVNPVIKKLSILCCNTKMKNMRLVNELKVSWVDFDFERRHLQAAGETQSSTGCPVMVHPGRHHDAPEEILHIYQEAGGSVDKLVLAHLDRTIHCLDALVEFASLGSYCEYDLFGIETSHYQLNHDIDMPSDAERIQRIKHLVDNGFQDKILIAHDIHTKHRLVTYGGHGFSHILRNVVPKMLQRSLTQDHVDKILISNPMKWLTFTK
ncbi:unnamed protein product, partial [Meganyctiphanes norvegica]